MKKPQNRTPTGRFPKGASGNPGGRPKGIAAYVREQTKEGTELVDLMLLVGGKGGHIAWAEYGRRLFGVPFAMENGNPVPFIRAPMDMREMWS